MKMILAIAAVAALQLTGCASQHVNDSEMHGKCSPSDVCHYRHHHHNSRQHHEKVFYENL